MFPITGGFKGMGEHLILCGSFIGTFLFMSSLALFFFWEDIRAYLQPKIAFYREIYKNTTWKLIVELFLFQLRNQASLHLESGLLTNLGNAYNLDYYDGSTKYSVRFPKKRGPCPFSKVEYVKEECIRDSDGVTSVAYIIDVTEKIRKFAGPCHNFHGIETTPKMLGYKSLTFYFRTDNEVTFSENQPIVLQYPIR